MEDIAKTVHVRTPWTSYAGGGESARGRITARDRAEARADGQPQWTAAAQRAARKIFGATRLTGITRLDTSDAYTATVVDARGFVRGTVVVVVE
jgi:hypothetical protein